MTKSPPPERTSVRERVAFLNTVIGKMSGVISDADEIHARQLATVTPHGSRAFLVEAFNHILISPVVLSACAGRAAIPKGHYRVRGEG